MKSAFCEYMNDNVEGFAESIVNVFENRIKKLPLKERQGIKEQIKKNFSLFFNEDEWKNQSKSNNEIEYESENDLDENDSESDESENESNSDESDSENDSESESDDESESDNESENDSDESENEFDDDSESESDESDSESESSDESDSDDEKTRITKKRKTKSDDEKFDFTWFKDHKPTPHTNAKVWGKKYVKSLNNRVFYHSANRVAFTKNKDGEFIFVGIVQENKKLLRYSQNSFPRYVIKWVRDCKIIIPSKQ